MTTDDDEWTSADEPLNLEKTAAATERMSQVPAAPVEPPWPAAEPPTPDPGTEPITAASEAAVAGGPAPVAPGKVAKSAPSKRNTKKWVGLGLVGALLLVIAGLGGTEFYLRHEVKQCISKAFGSLTGETATVALSSKPMLLQVLAKEIPFVEVNSSGSGEGRLHLRVDDITSSGNQSTIGKIDGNGVMPFAQILATARAAGPVSGGNDPTSQVGAASQLQSIKSNGDGTFDVTVTVQAVIIPLPVTVTLRPTLQDGKPHLEVVQASMLVFGIPPDLAQNVVNDLTNAMFSEGLRDMKMSKFEVEGEGIAFALSGENITADENFVRPQGNCGELVTFTG